MKTVKLFVNDNETSKNVSKIVKEKLEIANFQIVEDNYDLAIAIGGDGSFLRMIKNTNFNENCLYIGINAGTLGFAQEVNIEEIDQFILDLKDKNYKVENIGIQEIEIKTPDTISKQLSLNEMIVRDMELNTANLKVLVEDVLLEDFVGDGLLLATSFGSTAYNLSFGGSIVYNTFHTLQLTPIAPLNNKSYRNLLNSVILPDNKEVVIKPFNRTKNLLITVDGDNNFYKNVDYVSSKVSGREIQILRMKNYNFIKKINDKFLK